VRAEAGGEVAAADSLRRGTAAATPPAGTPAPGAVGAAGARPEVSAADLTWLRGRRWAVPVAGVAPEALRDSYTESRGAGRPHDAIDIPAPLGTPVVAADDGQVLKLFESRGGGRTVYVLAPGGRFVHYYAHLDAYRPGLAEGQPVRRGDQLGTVGASGNARPDAPHLHFALARLDDPKRWWDGTPVNPFPLLRQGAGAR
jgi:murein DD-endopeptidase MepM/ murein hydrolase activator NlpD